MVEGPQLYLERGANTIRWQKNSFWCCFRSVNWIKVLRIYPIYQRCCTYQIFHKIQANQISQIATQIDSNRHIIFVFIVLDHVDAGNRSLAARVPFKWDFAIKSVPSNKNIGVIAKPSIFLFLLKSEPWDKNIILISSQRQMTGKRLWGGNEAIIAVLSSVAKADAEESRSTAGELRCTCRSTSTDK